MSLGKITAIEEVAELRVGQEGDGKAGVVPLIRALSGYSRYDGYRIQTTEHVCHVLIDNGQECCEDWGYMSSDDDLKSYIGEELLEVRLVDTALNRKKLDETLPYGLDCGGIMFVDFVTDKGVFQLAVYNAHNGYYGHSIVVVKDTEVLHNGCL